LASWSPARFVPDSD